MKANGDEATAPRIPIPGAAGAAIFAGLQSLAMHCGECSIRIEKKRVPGGGYTFWISNLTRPDNPAQKQEHQP